MLVFQERMQRARMVLSRICGSVFVLGFLSFFAVQYLDKRVFLNSQTTPVAQVVFIIIAISFLAAGVALLVQDKAAFNTKRPIGIATQRILGLVFAILAIVALCNTGGAEGNASVWFKAVSHYFATGQVVR